MNSELFEEVAGQLIELLNVEIDKRDAQLDDLHKMVRDLRGSIDELDNSLWDVQRQLNSAREENRSLRNIPTEKVNVKQIKLDVLLELATAHPEWAGEILLLQFPDADVASLLGNIAELMASNKKIEAIKLFRGLAPRQNYSDEPETKAGIYLKQAKEFVESYGGEVNLNDLQGESK